MSVHRLPGSEPQALKSGASMHLADLLRAQLLDGRLVVGDALPSEAELRVRGRAGRNVVRAALDLLRRDGFITRRPGRGTIVATQRLPLRLDRPTGISGSFGGKGHRVMTRFRSIVEEQPVELVGQRLGLEPGASSLVVDYETTVDDRPYSLATSYLPVDRCRGRFDTDLAGRWLGDWFQVLNSLGFELGALELRVEAAAAEEAVATVLGVPTGSPVFRFERLLLDVDGRPLDYGFSRCLGTAVVIDLSVTTLADGPVPAVPVERVS